MHAYQLPQPNPTPPRRPRRSPRSGTRRRQDPYRVMAMEATVKIGVNVLLSLVAIVTLAKLLPYRSNQESRLQELNAAVKTADDRFSRVKNSFLFYFDPNQTRFLMQQQTNRIEPSQRQVILQESPKGEATKGEAAKPQ